LFIRAADPERFDPLQERAELRAAGISLAAEIWVRHPFSASWDRTPTIKNTGGRNGWFIFGTDGAPIHGFPSMESALAWLDAATDHAIATVDVIDGADVTTLERIDPACCWRHNIHLAREDREPSGLHPDGCYFCGRDHSSRSCTDIERDLVLEQSR